MRALSIFSLAQYLALSMAVKGDGTLYRKEGGFWLGSAVASHATGVPVEWASVQTVRACEKRGWLKRTHRYQEEWRDTREITEAGRVALADVRDIGGFGRAATTES